jgi:uroporphyrinogen-III synthase
MIARSPPEEAPMPTSTLQRSLALAGASVIVTRPPSSSAALVRGVWARGGSAVRLPGMRLAAAENAVAVGAALAAARTFDAWIFTSPPSVEYFFRMASPGRLSTATRVFAVGGATARALARHGIASLAPAREQNSEGLLEAPALADPLGWSIAIIDAPGGRDLLAPALRERGAEVEHIAVYRRLPPRLTHRHLESLERAPRPWLSLLSSSLALSHLLAALPDAMIERWRQEAMIVSSERLAGLAHASGFVDVHVARTALTRDLLDRACAVLARHRL